MIRFINLTGQILIDDTEPHFAWYDTIHDEFMEFNGSQDWHSWNEFVEDLIIHIKDDRDWSEKIANEVLGRFHKLFQPKTSQTNSDPF